MQAKILAVGNPADRIGRNNISPGRNAGAFLHLCPAAMSKEAPRQETERLGA
jgi:hypothetical protein